MPVYYEVNLKVDRSIELDTLRWLKKHIEEMEEIEGILPNTQVFAQEGDCLQICVWYKFSNLTFYQRYINEQAVEMRGRLPKEFVEKIQFSRRLLIEYPLSNFSESSSL